VYVERKEYGRCHKTKLIPSQNADPYYNMLTPFCSTGESKKSMHPIMINVDPIIDQIYPILQLTPD
jgi:hypothetical protein